MTQEKELKTPSRDLPDGKLLGEASSRQRSSSPAGSWTYRVRDIAGSNVNSGVSTPAGNSKLRVSSTGALLGPRPGAPPLRASYESALLQTFRKQIDNFQEKVNSQISKIQIHNEKLREVTFSRIEEQMATSENFQPEIERRIAGLTGNFQGLSEEMARQSRRVDSMDEKMSETTVRIERELRGKLSGIQQQINKAYFADDSQTLDMQKQQNVRLEILEQTSGEACKSIEEMHAALVDLHSRIAVIEDRSEHQDVISLSPAEIRARSKAQEEFEDSSALLRIFEKRISDISAKLSQTEQASSQLHFDFKSHDEQLKGLRSLLDAREEKFRSYMDKDRERMDFEARLEQMKRGFEEDTLQNHEKLETAMKRLESQEHALNQIWDRQLGVMGFDGSPSVIANLELTGATKNQFNYVEFRVRKLEEKIEEQIWKFQTSDETVGHIVTQLQGLVPKLSEVDTTRRDLEALQARLNDVFTQKEMDVRKDVDALKISITELAGKEENHCQQTLAMLEALKMLNDKVDSEESISREDFSATIKHMKDEQGVVAATLQAFNDLKDEVRTLKCQFDHLESVTNAVYGGTIDDNEQEQLTEQRLLDRIDELCGHIANVDTVVNKCISVAQLTGGGKKPVALSA